MMSRELERYLNDHLAGSSGALLLIDQLSECMDDPTAREDLSRLKEDVLKDRELLEHLLKQSGADPSTFLKAAGEITGRMGMFKLWWEGMESGKLGMFEALEILALGVQGKRLLWRALDSISDRIPGWKDVDFSQLEADALRQRDRVEHWRMEAAKASLGKVSD